MDLTLSNKPKWPNMIVFPTELRDAIPEYGPRALVFDSVAGAPHGSPSPASGMYFTDRWDLGPRAHIQLLVHETGKLDGKFALHADLDSATTRALGEFLIDLANRADALK